MITTLCIEGTKGAGKTTTIQNLKTTLEDMGHTVIIKAPFYDVRAELKRQTGFENTYPASLDHYAAPICNNLLIQQIKTDLRAKKENEFLIFDRGWLTGLTTLLGSVLSQQEKETELKRWTDLMTDTVFIHTKPENTLVIRQNELCLNIGLKDKKMIENDYALRSKLIRQYKKCVIATYETEPLHPDKEIRQQHLLDDILQKIA